MAYDYSALQSRIADELARTDLTSQIALEILTAIKHYEQQRFWFDEARATASTVASTANLAVPTDLIAIDTLTITYNGHPYELTERSWDWYRSIGGGDSSITTAVPTDFAYYNNELWFYPVPDNAYALTIAYLKQLTALSSGTDSNAWTVNGEEMIRARAKAGVRCNYLYDPEAVQERQMFAARGEPYLCALEKIAHQALVGQSNVRLSTGRLKRFDF
jgi:hypothetical protein